MNNDRRLAFFGTILAIGSPALTYVWPEQKILGVLSVGAAGLATLLWVYLETRAHRKSFKLPIWSLSALSVLIVLVWAQRLIVPADPLILYERDPESWVGHSQSERALPLDEDTTLEFSNAEFQRLNPQVIAEIGLQNAQLFIYFPPEIRVVGALNFWQHIGNNVFVADVGDINPGTIKGVNEAINISAQSPGAFKVGYWIAGQNAGSRQPQPHRHFWIMKR